MGLGNIIRGAVIGSGRTIKSSLSPHIYRSIAKESGISLEYNIIPLPFYPDKNQMESEFKSFFPKLWSDKKLDFVNVTSPFKSMVLDCVEALNITANANNAGAANVIYKSYDGSLHASNKDGVGLMRHFTEDLKWDVSGSRVLILGSGGATRGIIPVLGTAGAKITIMSRNTLVADSLSLSFRSIRGIRSVSTEHVPEVPYDYIINATPAEELNLPPGIFSDNTRFYDLQYGEMPKPLMHLALSFGIKPENISDGYGMLVKICHESLKTIGVLKEDHTISPETRTFTPETIVCRP